MSGVKRGSHRVHLMADGKPACGASRRPPGQVIMAVTWPDVTCLSCCNSWAMAVAQCRHLIASAQVPIIVESTPKARTSWVEDRFLNG